MLRRWRAPAPPRPPLSSMWWAEADGGALPALPSSDPFDGCPAFPPEPAGGVVAANPPVTRTAWPEPERPQSGRPQSGRPEPEQPEPGRPEPERPAVSGARLPSSGDRRTSSVARSATPDDTDEWLPLLTHEHQRFQLDPEELCPASPSGRAAGSSPSCATGPDVAATPTAIDRLAAASLAGAFAADYLSWDETGPLRRGHVLAEYLARDQRAHISATALRGWSGSGRQRADFALPGAVRSTEAGRVVVDVRVRITPYRAVGVAADPAQLDAGELERADGPAVAPAPTARGWKSLDSMWVRLRVPVILDGDRLVVDLNDGALSGPSEPSGTDHTVEASPVPADEPERRPPTPADLAAVRAKRAGSAGVPACGGGRSRSAPSTPSATAPSTAEGAP